MSRRSQPGYIGGNVSFFEVWLDATSQAYITRQIAPTSLTRHRLFQPFQSRGFVLFDRDLDGSLRYIEATFSDVIKERFTVDDLPRLRGTEMMGRAYSGAGVKPSLWPGLEWFQHDCDRRISVAAQKHQTAKPLRYSQQQLFVVPHPN